MSSVVKILGIIVLYKRNLFSAQSYKQFAEKYLCDDNFGLFVFDNSPDPNHSTIDFKGTKIVYFSDPSNPGVSKAYNVGVEYAKTHGFEWVLLLDQDTEFPVDNYFPVLVKSISLFTSQKIFVPIVLSYGGELLSPASFGFWGEKTLSLGINRLKGKSFINSGMCINVSFYEQVGGYNEKVPLDYSDHQFVSRCKKFTSTFVLIDYVLRQNYSDEIVNKAQAIERFTRYCKSILSFESESDFTRLFLSYEIVKHTIALSFKYKTLFFFKTLFISLKNKK